MFKYYYRDSNVSEKKMMKKNEQLETASNESNDAKIINLGNSDLNVKHFIREYIENWDVNIVGLAEIIYNELYNDVISYNGDFFEISESNLSKIDEIASKIVDGMQKYLTENEIDVVNKRWDGETLTNAELQTLHRIRKKQEHAITILKHRVEFFEIFDI